MAEQQHQGVRIHHTPYMREYPAEPHRKATATLECDVETGWTLDGNDAGALADYACRQMVKAAMEANGYDRVDWDESTFEVLPGRDVKGMTIILKIPLWRSRPTHALVVDTKPKPALEDTFEAKQAASSALSMLAATIKQGAK